MYKMRGSFMKKKLVLALLMAALLAGGAFAQININMSAGLGGNFGMHMTSYSGGGESESHNIVGGGFHAFFDATYAIAKAGMFFGGNSEKHDWGMGDPVTVKTSFTYFSLGLLGKYPIDLGSFTLFPMLGFEYNIFMSGKSSAEGESEKFKRSDLDSSSDFDAFILQLGAGADFNLTDKIYLRPSILWGIDLFRSNEEKVLKALDVSVFKHKLDIGIAVGYKF